jgi:gliding motility-associated lipoprotein GldD
MLIRFLTLLSTLSLVLACSRPAPIPKPRGYPRVVYPDKVYQAFDKNYCNFTFQYPNYAVVQRDTDYFDTKPVDPCWFNLYLPNFDCRIYCTYYSIGKGKTLEKLKSDAFELVDWHNKKANYIDEQKIERNATVQGMAFTIDGPAATPFQFYLTDNKQHFMRASLYFNTKINADSLAPIYDFVKADMIKMIDTFEWNK